MHFVARALRGQQLDLRAGQRPVEPGLGRGARDRGALALGGGIAQRHARIGSGLAGASLAGALEALHQADPAHGHEIGCQRAGVLAGDRDVVQAQQQLRIG